MIMGNMKKKCLYCIKNCYIDMLLNDCTLEMNFCLGIWIQSEWSVFGYIKMWTNQKITPQLNA